MIQSPSSIVLDAGVVIKRFVRTADSDQARAVFSFLMNEANPTTLYVPDLLYAECANILWKYIRFEQYARAQAREDLLGIHHMQFSAIPCSQLVDAALTIACEWHISCYDACYVALAHQLDTLLITTDRKLADHLAGSPYQIRSLQAYADIIQHG